MQKRKKSLKKTKIFAAVFALIFLFFFSNDCGLIDVEKTAIIAAVAVDLDENGEYEVCAQVAVPKATDHTTENDKAIISGKGKTVGGAVKQIGNRTGWFPKLAFCNLVIVGESLSDGNVIKGVDYFCKTLRMQDSAVVVLAQGKAKDILKKATPLDDISSFALQKILLKDPGFDNDISTVSLRSFCEGYYSDARSSFMPIVKMVEKGGDNSGDSQNNSADGGNDSGGGNTSKKDKTLFDATTTALFLDGRKVGELDGELTLLKNLMLNASHETTLKVNGVKNASGGVDNYLLSVIENRSFLSLDADKSSLTVKINLDLYCIVSDVNAEKSRPSYTRTVKMPSEVKETAENYYAEKLYDLFLTEKNTLSDFLCIKEKLYRFCHPYYLRYKDTFISDMDCVISVNIHGQK